MRSIMVLNAKGGCGKSTLATNLAAYYANQGQSVALIDLDPQGSSLDWLAQRPAHAPAIEGRDPESLKPLPRDKDILIWDAPAGVHGRELHQLIRPAESILLPVLPSPMDIRACQRFIEELRGDTRVRKGQVKLAVVANRVRENTLIYLALHQYLKGLRVPFVATLRDSQNYIRAADRGLGIFELAPSLSAIDLEQWMGILRWLRSKRSQPDA